MSGVSTQFEAFAQFKELHAKELEAAFESFFETPDFSGKFSAVLKMSQYQLKTGGKRIRACLPGWFFKALGKPPAEAIALGLAIELIHNATLVHDDLQDGDEYRRGNPTVWKTFGPAQAINCGDALFYFSNLALLKLNINAQAKEKLFRHFSFNMLQVIEGQAQEFVMKEESYPSVQRYKTVVQGKTSGLFEMPVVSALVALDQSEALVQSAKKACALLGVLFQMQDDIIDIYGDKGRNKKASDISEGKVSYLVAHVFEKGSPSQKSLLNEILRKSRESTTEQDTQAALQIFKETNALQSALDEMQEMKSQIQLICQEMPQALQEAFLQLANFVLTPAK